MNEIKNCIMIDLDEKDLSRKCKFVNKDGGVEYFPFYEIKIENGKSAFTTKISTWKPAKDRKAYYQRNSFIEDKS